MNYHDRLTERERIHIHAQIKHENIKAEAIDILIDALHRQMRGGGTVSFDHNLAAKIEKLIIGHTPRAEIIALVRTGIYPVISLRSSKDPLWAGSSGESRLIVHSNGQRSQGPPTKQRTRSKKLRADSTARSP